jgi:hypothetical protein
MVNIIAEQKFQIIFVEDHLKTSELVRSSLFSLLYVEQNNTQKKIKNKKIHNQWEYD